MLTWALLAGGAWLAERLPGRPLYAAGRMVALLLAALPSAPRARLRRNLARATQLPLESPRLNTLVLRVYRTQVQNYLDLLRTRRASPAVAAARVRQTGPGWQSFLEAARSGRGCVLVSAHFGRIELLNQFLAQFGLPMTLPVERITPPRLFELVCALRSHFGVKIVPRDTGVRPLLRALTRGDVVILFADWDLTGQGIAVPLFGQPARLPPGPAFLALRGKAPLFVGVHLLEGVHGDAQGGARAARPVTDLAYMSAPLELERTGDIDADVRRGTERIAVELERLIARHPEQWVMFHDVWAGNGSGVRESAPGPVTGPGADTAAHL
ncbi:MAG: hypothetical protein AVDCRST_MAG77-1058 [uncultured Chloroflexi bacterium]|uniref:Lipid A biosynthesis lauroyl acyltransferase n=1 Tax=uncultured Chloroflexota bacterium TaxID=166587 RepID=A0A6J4HUB7_9CHLR|nr:MAG: hypothetical protein AVDCRST_MAG77-1058 [uncultured Chloroflexota bacterium]